VAFVGAEKFSEFYITLYITTHDVNYLNSQAMLVGCVGGTGLLIIS